MLLFNIVALLLSVIPFVCYFGYGAISGKKFHKQIKTMAGGFACFLVYTLGYILMAGAASKQYTASDTKQIGLLFIGGLAVAFILTEAVRFLLMRTALRQYNTAFNGFQFGVGFSILEFLILFLLPGVVALGRGTASLLQASFVIVSHIVIQILCSASAYAFLQRKQKIAFFAAMLPYYVVVLFDYLIKTTMLLNAVRVFVLLVTIGLCWMAIDWKILLKRGGK